ncbi:unnamed protein product [Pleuronectes platessa]|uniref:DUF4200 domain-containing protein n=1 Tax=Pleuronectes platessa TaxID=8262 RepID=A0A9N7U882_PLEPL|nr:unnamed protein product [Pleuronectes platessa]
MFLKEADVNKTVEKAERERREALQKDKQIETLKKEKAELMQKKHKLDHQVQRHTVYRDIMEQMVAMTKFKDAELLADNLESQLHLREQLCQREREAEETRMTRHRKSLLRNRNMGIKPVQDAVHVSCLTKEATTVHMQY